MREHFEALEYQVLAPYAAKSGASQGRVYPEPLSDTRTLFQHDRDRIVHAKSFRRLKHKTQVFVATESDHYRSRLTHTLEVAQLSRHLARLLRLNEDLSECIALAHDLGHTPFGHSGERELNRLVEHVGGFEHNLQSLRIVDELEQKYPQFPGLNLSFEVRHGLRKHDKDRPVTLEAQLVNLADEIAYNNHDLDDGLSARILEESFLTEHVTLWREAKAKVKKQYTNLEETQLKTLINSCLIAWQLTDVLQATQTQLTESGVQSVADLQQHGVLVSFGSEMKAMNQELRKVLFQNFYQHMSVYRMNKKGQRIIRTLFERFSEDPRLLPEHYRLRIGHPHPKERVVADYIAGMTDTFALKEVESL